MKNYINLLALVVLIFFGCESKFETYSGESVVYLSGYSNPNADTTKISFTYINKDSTYVPVFIQLKTIGNQTTYNREIRLSVSSKNCVEGVDFDPVDEVQILEANSFIKTVQFNLKRTDALQLEEKIIDVELRESKDFKLLYPSLSYKNDTLTTLKHTIVFSELMTEAPKTWTMSHFGTFSAKKFITICNEMNISRDQFIDPIYMTAGRKNYIKTQMIKILKAAKDNGTPFYEADGVTEITMG